MTELRDLSNVVFAYSNVTIEDPRFPRRHFFCPNCKLVDCSWSLERTLSTNEGDNFVIQFFQKCHRNLVKNTFRARFFKLHRFVTSNICDDSRLCCQPPKNPNIIARSPSIDHIYARLYANDVTCSFFQILLLALFKILLSSWKSCVSS